jgi:putative ABC transport system permease protein
VFKHYLVVAWLTLRRSPFAAAINIFTLALGLVCFILASTIAGFWSRADQHFANASRTVVMTSEWQFNDGSESSGGVAMPTTNHQLGGLLKADYPQIEAVARVARLAEETPVRVGDQTVGLRGFAADAQFLHIFDLPFISGDSRDALRAPGSVVLTQETARNLFGSARSLGRSITLFGKIDATVTGVIDRIPDPSHMGQSTGAPLRFDLLASRDIYESFMRTLTGGRDTTQLPVDWLWGPNTTYVLLPENGALTQRMLREQLPALAQRHIPASLRERVQVGLDVVPVSDLLGMALRDSLLPRESAVSVPLLLFVLGAIVLFVACINFANLATARAAGRARETGVRKAIGARPRQVMTQYLFEAALLTLAAMLVAVAFVSMLLPMLANATGIDVTALWSANLVARAFAPLLALGFVVTLAAGFYPAFILSRVQPAQAVRAVPTQGGSRTLGSLLVGIQFAFAAFLLIAVSIVHEQNTRLKRAGEQIAGDSLLVIENTPEITGLRQEILQQEVLRLPHVISDTAMETLPWTNEFRRMPLSSSPAASAVQHTAHLYITGYDFFHAFDVELLAGRVFDPQRADDVQVRGPNPSRAQNLVISRALAEELGFSSPAAAVGRTIYIPMSITGEQRSRPFHIIGVVENKALNIASRYGPIPSVYLFDPFSRFHIVRIAEGKTDEALRAIDALWKRLVPHVAPNPRFVADYFDDSYANFARINQAFTTLALIAWVISTIGLYAMAILISGRRIHEIAIRKTLGARTGQIVLMLLKSFTAPVLIANIIAWPFAYLAGRAYLNAFLDPIPLTPWPFLIALLVSLLIAWLAVGGQTWRAARSAPAQVMRFE